MGKKSSLYLSNAALLALSTLLATALGETALRAAVRFNWIPRDRGFASFVLQSEDFNRTGFTTLLAYTRTNFAGREPRLFRATPNSELGWEPVPNAHAGAVRINAGGFRGPDVSALPAPGVTRIAVIGDSHAFGMHLAEDETLAGALERKLNAASRKGTFEVLNFGVPGYNTDKELLVLRRKVLAHQPSIIVLYFCFNDPEIAERTMLMEGGRLSSSYLYMLVAYTFKVRASMADLGHSSIVYVGDLVDYHLDLHRSFYFTRCAALIRRMALESESHGARFYLAIAPELIGFEHFADYPFDEIHARLRALESGSVRVIDPLDAFRNAYDSPRSLWANEHDPHLNAVATSMVADVAVERILSETISP